MKTILPPLFFCAFLFFCSCGNQPRPTSPDLPFEEQTPDVLSPGSGSDLLTSVGKKRYWPNIVDQLFEEAMEKDAALKQLYIELKTIGDKKGEILKPYGTYLTTNQNYWVFTETYTNNISDTLTRAAVKQFFSKFKNEYQERIQPLETASEEIAIQSIDLNDQLSILKLMVSAQLMENYQKNELPDLVPLENLIKEYEQLIEKTQQKISKLKSTN